ncbi:MAG: hypothetical protein IPN94_19930 [Sphingobacteriales bacterium]|nr:hypothetical protein [Sphingobacteriales bacterium]
MPVKEVLEDAEVKLSSTEVATDICQLEATSRSRQQLGNNSLRYICPIRVPIGLGLLTQVLTMP